MIYTANPPPSSNLATPKTRRLFEVANSGYACAGRDSPDDGIEWTPTKVAPGSTARLNPLMKMRAATKSTPTLILVASSIAF
jgi:hypothetical protein